MSSMLTVKQRVKQKSDTDVQQRSRDEYNPKRRDQKVSGVLS